jgi:phosphate transport system substrate-binding protein
MISMSNQKPERKVGRWVALAVVIIIVIIAGGFGYQMMVSQSQTTQTSMTESMTSMSGSETMTETMTGGETSAQSAVALLGAGATFPAPLIQKWTVEYHNLYSSVTINYNPIGSGGGIQQITQKTVDFGASDAPLTDEQLAAAPGLVLMPETLGGVAVTYNLQSFGVSNSTVLHFTSDVIAGIYMGRITMWSDPALVALNPSVHLPNQPITAVHRSDGSGTTYAFTDFLSTVNSDWSSTVGHSTSVTWPVDKTSAGVGAKGNAGVAGSVANTPGAVGYVDVIYAVSNNLGVGAVRNAAGNFVVPTLQTILWAAANATGTPNPGDLRMHIVNAPGAQSYPIATYTYILVYKEMSTNPSMTLDKSKALAKFLWWAIHDGQQYSEALIYVRLPQNIVQADEQLLNSLTFQGQTLLSS